MKIKSIQLTTHIITSEYKTFVQLNYYIQSKQYPNNIYLDLETGEVFQVTKLNENYHQFTPYIF